MSGYHSDLWHTPISFEEALVAAMDPASSESWKIFAYLEIHAHTSNYKELDEALKRVVPGEVTDVGLMCFIRGCHPFHMHLAAYNDILLRACLYFERCGKDPYKIRTRCLQGLIARPSVDTNPNP